MEGRRTLLLLLGAFLVLRNAEVHATADRGIYTNTWAIHIEGGAEEAERIARKHGFISHGRVSGISSLSKIYPLFCVATFVYVEIMLNETAKHHLPFCCQAVPLYAGERHICTNTHPRTYTKSLERVLVDACRVAMSCACHHSIH